MSDNKGRVLTILVEVQDSEAAKAIWEKHMSRELMEGCTVNGIADGDLLQRCEDLEDELVEMVERDE